MIAGFLLVIGGVAQAVAGLRSEVTLITALGGVWIVAGVVNIVTSSIARRGRPSTSPDDLANPVAMARVHQGVTGQLPRGLITLLAALAAIVAGIWAPALQGHEALRVMVILCGAVVGFLALLGLLLYAASGTERAATVPATVVILGYKELPLNNDSGRPYVRFVLDVHPEGMTHYEATVQAIVPMLTVPKLAVGAQFPALVAGPQKPDAVIVDWLRPVGAAEAPAAVSPPAPVPAVTGSPSPTDRLRELEALRGQGLVTDAEYAEQRARIIGSV